MKLPAIFLSHGAPTLAVEQSDATRAWAQLAAELPRPKSILAVSAHWDTDAPAASTSTQPETIHDFSGFPRALYEVRYPAPGAPDLGARAAQLLGDAGLAARLDPARGLDHGAWVPLKWMYPGADIPVAQLSVQSERGPRHHLALGQALAPLRDEGVLVLASGGIVHNLREIHWQAKEPIEWARAFNDWIADRASAGAVEELLTIANTHPRRSAATPRRSTWSRSSSPSAPAACRPGASRSVSSSARSGWTPTSSAKTGVRHEFRWSEHEFRYLEFVSDTSF